MVLSGVAMAVFIYFVLELLMESILVKRFSNVVEVGSFCLERPTLRSSSCVFARTDLGVKLPMSASIRSWIVRAAFPDNCW